MSELSSATLQAHIFHNQAGANETGDRTANGSEAKREHSDVHSQRYEAADRGGEQNGEKPSPWNVTGDKHRRAFVARQLAAARRTKRRGIISREFFLAMRTVH
jgi:hypothetical protein